MAVQWFSLPRPRAALPLAGAARGRLRGTGVQPHNRKLPRGALAGNRFTIRLRALSGTGAQLQAALAPRLEADQPRRACPNYFGRSASGATGPIWSAWRQAAALAAPCRARLRAFGRAQRHLQRRARRSAWPRAPGGSCCAGDLANLDGRGSFFAVDSADAVLDERARALNIHPTGPLWGAGAPATRGAVRELEEHTAARFAQEAALCTAAGMEQERRSLRFAVHGLDCSAEAEAVYCASGSAAAAYATAVLRELVERPKARLMPEGSALDSSTYTAPVPPSTGRAET